MSDVDVRTVTLAEAETRIVRAFRKKRPVFLWGMPGVGKSELMQKIAVGGKLGKKVKLIDVRVALMEPTDLPAASACLYYSVKSLDSSYSRLALAKSSSNLSAMMM